MLYTIQSETSLRSAFPTELEIPFTLSTWPHWPSAYTVQVPTLSIAMPGAPSSDRGIEFAIDARQVTFLLVTECFTQFSGSNS